MKAPLSRKNVKERQQAIFLDRDGVINDDSLFIQQPGDMHLLPGVAEAIRDINQSKYLSIVATNQSVIARNVCTEQELGLIHQKMEADLQKKQACLDAIYYCPHDAGNDFTGGNPAFCIECDCRKPKPGLLLKAAEDWNIDLGASYFIGDHERDIKAGLAAGVISVGVGTGKGIRDSMTKPHYFFMNLGEAVNFIISSPYADLANELADKVKASEKKPYIILIGGNTQSGKSILASYLRQSFSQQGISTLKIMLDDWLPPTPARKKTQDLLHMVPAEKIRSDIKRILQGGQISLTGYHPIPGKKPIPETYRYRGEKVIIIEGLAALGIPYLREIADMGLQKEISAEEHLQRVVAHFSWKGYASEDAEILHSQKISTEYKMVDSWKKFASITVY